VLFKIVFDVEVLVVFPAHGHQPVCHLDDNSVVNSIELKA